jgi:hypothetical protein
MLKQLEVFENAISFDYKVLSKKIITLVWILNKILYNEFKKRSQCFFLKE